jgi:hypothetical protein
MTETVADGYPEPPAESESPTNLPPQPAIEPEAEPTLVLEAAETAKPRNQLLTLSFWASFGLDILLIALIVIGYRPAPR